MQFFVIYRTLKSGNLVKHAGGLADVSRSGIVVHQHVVQRVRTVGGNTIFVVYGPDGVAYLRVFSQVGQSDDVAVVGGAGRLVRNPDFHALDGDSAGNGGERLHVAVVLLAEEVVQEEVAVLFVVGGRELKGVGLASAFAAYTFARAFLLAYHGLHLQTAELHVGAQAEKAAYARHQTHVAGERDVTGLNQLDNVIFLAVIFQL